MNMSSISSSRLQKCRPFHRSHFFLFCLCRYWLGPLFRLSNGSLGSFYLFSRTERKVLADAAAWVIQVDVGARGGRKRPSRHRTFHERRLLSLSSSPPPNINDQMAEYDPPVSIEDDNRRSNQQRKRKNGRPARNGDLAPARLVTGDGEEEEEERRRRRRLRLHHRRDDSPDEALRLCHLLRKYGYDYRLEHIRHTPTYSPVYAEAFLGGQSVMVRIVKFLWSDRHQDQSQSPSSSFCWTTEPKVVVELLEGNVFDGDDPLEGTNTTSPRSSRRQRELKDGVGTHEKQVTATLPSTKILDFPQITTVFATQGTTLSLSQKIGSAASSTNRFRISRPKLRLASVEKVLDHLYGSRVGRGRAGVSTAGRDSADGSRISGGSLSKKQIVAVVREWFNDATASSSTMLKGQSHKLEGEPEQHLQHAERVLRQVVKTGAGSSRLIDATTLLAKFVDNVGTSKSNESTSGAMMIASASSASSLLPEYTRSLRWAGQVLSMDAATGGRFKRWPCVFVGTNSDDPRWDGDEGRIGDSSAARTVHFLNGGWLVVDQNVRAGTEARKFVDRGTSPSRSSNDTAHPLHTDAPTRNAPATFRTHADRRIIQRLECLALGEALIQHQSVSTKDRLEVDVREALVAMNLPLTPQGAKEALLQVGYWTREIDAKHVRVEPWPRPVLEAAAWYVTRRSSGDLTPVGADGRNDRVIDLTSYPCLCIDAQRTRFRDDALGLRPREATGRSVVPGASKWEVLVHVVDVSDIYSVSSHKRLGEDERNRLALLKDASRTRGTSRYDLPLGPLHLLPPRVLESLSFSSKSPGHRCVTLWAYIDERCGKLIDCGLERTLVRPPRILSFSEASELTSQSAKAPESDANLRSMLLVLERILTSWSQLRRKNEDAARKREERLSMRELAGRMDHKQASLAVDDGRHGFQRSRGHRLVDSALDLYSAGVSTLIRKAKEPIPQAKGADCSRGGRVATAPLRRYIDGEAQRQALAVILDQGPRISAAECKEIGKVANEARNSIATIRAARNV